MTYFKELEGDVAILASGGVYKQVPLYSFEGFLFAQAGGGYVRLAADGSTSKDKLRIVKLITNNELFLDPMGRLAIEKGEKYKPLMEDDRKKLAGPEGT